MPNSEDTTNSVQAQIEVLRAELQRNRAVHESETIGTSIPRFNDYAHIRTFANEQAERFIVDHGNHMAYQAARFTMQRVVAHDMILYSLILGQLNARYRVQYEQNAFSVSPTPGGAFMEPATHQAARSILGGLEGQNRDRNIIEYGDRYRRLIHQLLLEAETELQYLQMMLAPPEDIPDSEDEL